MNNASVSNQLQDMWRTRPVRLPRQGKLAGVAAGIGYRYQVDPMLVRVALVVTTIFGGAGVVFYLAAWLLLPRAGDGASAAEALMGRGHSSESQTKTIVLMVALAIAVSTAGPVGVGLGASGLIGAAVLLGGLWMFHQRHPIPEPLPPAAYPNAPGLFPGEHACPSTPYGTAWYPTAPYGTGPFGAATGTSQTETSWIGAANTDTANTDTVDANRVGTENQSSDHAAIDLSKPTAAPAAESRRAPVVTPPVTPPVFTPAGHGFGPTAVPPAWDPLGVAPFAWDLPEPTPLRAPTTRRGPRSRLTSIVIGLTLLATAGIVAIAQLTDSTWLTPARIGAIALAMVGAGLILGSIRRTGHGLLLVAGPLAGFVILASIIGPLDFEGGIGERNYKPHALSELQSEYKLGVGELVVDLTAIALTSDRTVDVAIGAGDVLVIVPEGMNVRNNCSVELGGDVDCLAEVPDGGNDGPDRPALTLNARAQVGDVQVRRG